MKISIIEGPLLDRIDKREKEIYKVGSKDKMIESVRKKAAELEIDVEFLNSWSESELAKMIVDTECDGIVINPGAFTHTSVLIRDALLFARKPFIEVHISNLFKRENFRKHSFISDIADGFVCGLGAYGYSLALEYIYLKIIDES